MGAWGTPHPTPSANPSAPWAGARGRYGLKAQDPPRFKGGQPRGLGGFRRGGLALTEYVQQQTPEAGRAGQEAAGRSQLWPDCSAGGARQRPLGAGGGVTGRPLVLNGPGRLEVWRGGPGGCCRGAWEEIRVWTHHGAGDGADSCVTSDWRVTLGCRGGAGGDRAWPRAG